jgi:hypothetical protein
MTILYLVADNSGKPTSSSQARSHAARVGWERSTRVPKYKQQRHGGDADAALPERQRPTAPQEKTTQTVVEQPAKQSASTLDLEGQNRLSTWHQGAALPMLDWTTNPTSARVVAEFMGTHIWPMVGSRVVAHQWFTDYCSIRSLFHAQSAASATYRDLLMREQNVSATRWALLHKVQAIRHTRADLIGYNNLDIVRRQQVIFTILIMGSHDLKPKDLAERTWPTHLQPHFPTLHLLHLWGRTDPVTAHDEAAFRLIENEGGLRMLDLPGVAGMAAFVDLLRSLSLLHKPRFPCHWPGHMADLLFDPNEEAYKLGNIGATLAGTGFLQLRPALSKDAVSVLTEVALLD